MDFHFATEVRVRFAETDAQGVAHHAVYLVWFEVARIEYLARFRGGYPELRAEGIEALTTEAHVSYLAPARFATWLAQPNQLLVQDADGALRGLNPATGQTTARMAGHPAMVRVATIDRSGARLADRVFAVADSAGSAVDRAPCYRRLRPTGIPRSARARARPACV